MAVFPFPQLAELREKYTYNITPFPTSVKSNGRLVQSQELSLMSPRRGFRSANAEELWGFCLLSGGVSSWESDDDADMDDEDAMVTALGCLGPLGGLLAPELQRYQKQLKGGCSLAPPPPDKSPTSSSTSRSSKDRI